MVSETLTAFPALAQTTASAVSPDPAAQVPVLPLIWLSGALLLGLYFALGDWLLDALHNGGQE